MDFLKDIISLAINSFNNVRSEDIQNNRSDEKENNIASVTRVMVIKGYSDDEVSDIIEKSFDLRPSESKNFIAWAHKHI